MFLYGLLIPCYQQSIFNQPKPNPSQNDLFVKSLLQSINNVIFFVENTINLLKYITSSKPWLYIYPRINYFKVNKYS